MKRNNRLGKAVVSLYRDGYTEVQMVRGRDRLSFIHKLGTEWITLTQSNVNRWINGAIEDDPDLEVWHVLNKRKWKPGVYNNWRPDGRRVMLSHCYDPLADTLYLGPGDGYIPTGDWKPGNIVRIGQSREDRSVTKSRPVSDAVGPYVAELASLEYSCREIVALWNRHGTGHTRLDRKPRVRRLVQQLRYIREKPMSYSTIARILKTYSFKYAPGTTAHLDDAVGHLEIPSRAQE